MPLRGLSALSPRHWVVVALAWDLEWNVKFEFYFATHSVTWVNSFIWSHL